MRVERSAAMVVAFAVLGCSNVLGADFDQIEVSLSLPEHPHEVPHPGQPLPDSSLTGTGHVKTPDGRDCTASCTFTLDSGVLHLQALADEGSVFGGWRTQPPTECDNSRSTSCSLESTTDVVVDAYFVRNGANVWGSFAGVEEGESASFANVALVGDRIFGTGVYGGALANLSLPLADDPRLLVAEVGAEGEWRTATSLATAGKLVANTMASTSFGLVVTGRVEGEADLEATAELAPLGQPIEQNGAFAVAYEASDSTLEPRWSWIIGGEGLSDVLEVGVASDDTTFLLGTYEYSLVTPKTALTGKQGGNLFLAALDPNGNEKWLLPLGIGTGSGTVLAVQSTDHVVMAFRAKELSQLPGACPAPTDNRIVIARLDADGTCVATMELPESVSSIESLTVDQADNVYLEARFADAAQIGDTTASTFEDAAILIAALTPNLSWDGATSWNKVIDGLGKVTQIGASETGVLFTVNGDGPITVDGSTFEPGFAGGLLLGKLSPKGELEWIRGFKESPSARGLGVRWDAGSWLVAGEIEPDPFRPFDLENITQTPAFQKGSEAFIARFSD